MRFCEISSAILNNAFNQKKCIWNKIVMQDVSWTFMAISYNDVIMVAMASQNTSLTIVYSTVYSGTDQRKHQSFASLVFVWGIHRWAANSPHKRPVTRKMVPFDDVIMILQCNGRTTLKFPGDVQCPKVHIPLKFQRHFSMYRGDLVQSCHVRCA